MDVLCHPALFRSMSLVLTEMPFTSYMQAKHWIDSVIALKNKKFFQRGVHMLSEKWRKIIATDE